MNNYLTVQGVSQIEFTEKRSKFIATIKHCETETEALKFIEQLRSKYWDASHNCFAYATEKGKISRFSDDGEPHGTAGKPILDVINGAALTDTAVVVTRYFGGILLGTGGLSRAYSKAARDAVAAAKICKMVPCIVLHTVCEYQDHRKFMDLLETSGANIESSDFTDKVKVVYYIKEENFAAFAEKLREIFSGRLSAVERDKRIAAFDLKEE